MKRMFVALSHTSEGAIVLDEQFRIVFWNRGAQAILGHSPQQAIGRPCYEVVGGIDRHGSPLCQRHCRLYLGALRDRTVPNMDLQVQTRSGETRWLNLTSFPIATEAPRPRQLFVHIFRDVTRLRGQAQLVEELVDAARNLRRGVSETGPLPQPSPPTSDPSIEPLTPREWQVLRLLAHGLGTAELAETLSISPATTRNHIQRVLEKLGAHSRLEAVALAYQHGLVEVSRE